MQALLHSVKLCGQEGTQTAESWLGERLSLLRDGV